MKLEREGRLLRRPSVRLVALAALAGALGVLGGCNDLDEGGVGGGWGTGEPDRDGGGGAGGATTTTVETRPPAESTASGSSSIGTGIPGATGSTGAGELDCPDLNDPYQVVADVVVDDSNSFASPLLVRALVADDGWDAKRPLPVRPHEFLNYFAEPFSTSVLPGEGSLSIRVDAHADGYADTGTLIELGVTVSAAPDQAPSPDVTFLFDTSTTMQGEPTTRGIGVLRAAARALEPDQQIAVLSWSLSNPVLREMSPWQGEGVEDVVEAIANQEPETDFDAALDEALTISRERAVVSGRPGVVMVITDGKTAAGPTVLERVSAERDQGVPVRVVGVGVGPARAYSDEVLDALTDRSGGAYFYVPDASAADAEIEARFDQLTRIAAREVGLELHLPDAVEVVAVTGEQGEAGDGEPVDGQNLAAGGTMVFHVLLRVSDPATCQALGLAVRWTDLDGNAVRFPAGAEPAALEIASLFERQASPEMLRVSALAKVTAALRGPTNARIATATDALRGVLREPVDEDPLAELCTMLARRCEASEDPAACPTCSP